MTPARRTCEPRLRAHSLGKPIVVSGSSQALSPRKECERRGREQVGQSAIMASHHPIAIIGDLGVGGYGFPTAIPGRCWRAVLPKKGLFRQTSARTGADILEHPTNGPARADDNRAHKTSGRTTDRGTNPIALARVTYGKCRSTPDSRLSRSDSTRRTWPEVFLLLTAGSRVTDFFYFFSRFLRLDKTTNTTSFTGRGSLRRRDRRLPCAVPRCGCRP